MPTDAEAYIQSVNSESRPDDSKLLGVMRMFDRRCTIIKFKDGSSITKDWQTGNVSLMGAEETVDE